jgi:hypothetical protein
MFHRGWHGGSGANLAAAAGAGPRGTPREDGGGGGWNDAAAAPGGISRVRVRVLKFGDHLASPDGQGGGGGGGRLELVQNTGDHAMVKGMLLRGLYGDAIDFSTLDASAAQVFLLPDGDELTSPGESRQPCTARVAPFPHHLLPPPPPASHRRRAAVAQ